ncbi:cation:proton antiporter [Paraflavitalea pollutisoli]|uniref:cation:proton antiporter n=1 Tax=Paraflavitalea pollutisoli TaxID=3034143 RepID=UPI0023EA980E|nr:cation:proton antiporter [Paraflavitalea sp. H1-2-19X]
MHGLLFPLIALCFTILLLVPLLKRFHQPYLVAYIMAGIIIGPHVLGVFAEPGPVESVGELGVMLLMFFLGMEIDVPDKRSELLTPIAAQVVRTLLGAVVAAIAGHLLGWTLPAIVLLIVLLSFNSTAVVSEFLKKQGELQTDHGKMVLNILLLQDILLAPALTVFQLLGGQPVDVVRVLSAAGGSVLIFLLLRAIRNRNLLQLPLVKELEQDHDWQVFAAACICLGFGGLASLMGLTSAIGSFAAGIFIGRTKAFHWLGEVLQPFKVFFTALFFVSIGIILDLHYLLQHGWLLISITLLIMLINTLLSVAVFRTFKLPWRKSLYAGALLSQTGEFGLLACSLAGSMQIISPEVLKASLAITGLSLLLSTLWMGIVRRYTHQTAR